MCAEKVITELKSSPMVTKLAQQKFKQMFMDHVLPRLEEQGLPAKIFTIADRVYTQLTVGDAELTLQEAFSMFDLDTQCLQQLEHAGIFKLSDVMRVINHPATGKDRNILKLVEKSLPPAVLTMLKHRSVIFDIIELMDVIKAHKQCLQKLKDEAGISYKLSDVMRVINHPASEVDRIILKLVEDSLPPTAIKILMQHSDILEIIEKKAATGTEKELETEIKDILEKYSEKLKRKLKQAFAELLRAQVGKIISELKLSREVLQIVPVVYSTVYGVLEDAAGRDEANVGEIVGNILCK